MPQWVAVLNTLGYVQGGTWTYGTLPPGGYGVVDNLRVAAARGIATGVLVPVGPATLDPDGIAARELADSLNAGRPLAPPQTAPTYTRVDVPDLDARVTAALGICARTFEYPTPAASWSLTNPLPYPPAVTVVVAGEEVDADVERVGNTILITHSRPLAGVVYLS